MIEPIKIEGAGVEVYECPICKEPSVSRALFDIHMRRIHGLQSL
jgi:hypothetical protein